jgi:hypothetical protein
MTITELLLSNPGVELTLAYNETLGVFSVNAESSMCRFHSTVHKTAEDREPGLVLDAVKRGIKVVK